MSKSHFALVLPILRYWKERNVVRQKHYLSMWCLLTVEQMKFCFTLAHFFNNILIFKTSLELIASIRVSVFNFSHSINHILRWIFERVHNKNEFGWLKRQCRLLLIIFQSQYTSVGLWFLPGNPSGCFLLVTLKVTHLVYSHGIKEHEFQFVNSF